MKKQLWLQLGRETLVSFGIFASLFLVLSVVEWLFPSLRGTLLQWDSPAFCVGIPASISGTAYVLTIRNPQNYTGFYLGILMAALLAVQFYFLGNLDLVVLYSGLFIPFLFASLVNWRRKAFRANGASAKEDHAATQGRSLEEATANVSARTEEAAEAEGVKEAADNVSAGTEEAAAAEGPSFIGWPAFLCTLLISILLLAGDYALTTLAIYHDSWTSQIAVKLLSGGMIVTAIMANFWMIFQKNDAWIAWVLYSLVGMLFYTMIGNLFSFLLFTVFLIVNGGAQIAWLRQTPAHRFGWAGSEAYILRLRSYLHGPQAS